MAKITALTVSVASLAACGSEVRRKVARPEAPRAATGRGTPLPESMTSLRVCVRAALTREALGGATVVVASESTPTEHIKTADLHGKAVFPGISPGLYRVSVYYSSHLENRLREVAEAEAAGLDVDVPLPPGHAGGANGCSANSR